MNSYNQTDVNRRAKITGVVITVLMSCGGYLLATQGITFKSAATHLSMNQASPIAQSTAQPELAFHLLGSGEGMVRGIDASFQAYDSFDGVSLMFLTHTLSSADRAQHELEKRIETANKIIEESVERNRDGKVIAARVVILFSDSTNPNKEMASVLWTRKSDLFAIEASSIDHVLAFEKKYRR